jgi:hypothetical protein
MSENDPGGKPYNHNEEQAEAHKAALARRESPVGSIAGLVAAVEYEIAVAEKQIELLLLRIKEDPRSEKFIRPVGSNIHQMKRRLERALKAFKENDQP